jgi:type VI secretion system secreted protein VgrG
VQTRSQSNRQFAVTTPLGEDVLLFKRMAYAEELGRPFTMDLELLSEKADVRAEELLGQNVTVRVELPNHEGKTRYFNGLVGSFAQRATEEGLAAYSLKVVPWLWFLTRTSDCRIFQDMSAPDIIKQVFRDIGFTDFEDLLSGDYRTWEYCVQYRETAFAFVSRLMEQEGIYYYFKHDNGTHTMVLIDDAASHEPFPEYQEIAFRPYDRVLSDSELIHAFQVSKTVQPGVYVQTDFDFKAPTKELQAKSAAAREHDLSEFEIFDYPGEYAEATEGERYSSVRLDEMQCRHAVGSGHGDSRGIATGRTFKLLDHPIEALNEQYLVTSTRIEAEADPYGSTGGSVDQRDTTMNTSFTAIIATQQFRPARVTPSPMVRGPQTALVVGPSGEEVHSDEHGRVRVMFHWDREAEAKETDSCWVRVSQEFAGKKWGSMQIPRVGHEVIVSFLEGDPDRPLITGRVYNGDNAPPYDPKQFGTVATWKTNSSKGGGGFNELRFEDKKDEEQVFLHAQKNLDIRVLNDRFETVVNNRHVLVGNNKYEHVKNERHELVDADHLEQIKGDRNLTVGGKQSVKIDDTLSVKVAKDVCEEFDKNHSQVNKGDLYLKGKNVTIEAEQNLTLHVGETWIAIEKGGVKLSSGTGAVELDAKDIKVKSKMDTKIEALNYEAKAKVGAKIEGLKFEAKGSAAAKLEGGGIAEVKGALVKIN